MGRRSHPRRKKFQSWNGRTGNRRTRARSINADHHSLRRRRSLGLGRRKFAANGLQKREINGRWLQSLEGGWLTCDKITRALRRVESPAESRLSADGLVMAEAALPHELGDSPGASQPA